MTTTDPCGKIREYLSSLSTGNGLELSNYIRQEGKNAFEDFLKEIPRKDGSTISTAAVNSALNLIVTSTDDQSYVINQIIERIAKHF